MKIYIQAKIPKFKKFSYQIFGGWGRRALNQTKSYHMVIIVIIMIMPNTKIKYIKSCQLKMREILVVT